MYVLIIFFAASAFSPPAHYKTYETCMKVGYLVKQQSDGAVTGFYCIPSEG
jgi:hypothetical protein